MMEANPRPAAPVPPDMVTSPGPAADPTDVRHELISSLARNVTARHDLGDVLAATFTQLRTLVRFSGGSIQLVDDDGWIRLAAADPAAAEELYDVRIPLDGTVAGRIVLTERPIYLPDIDDAPLATPPPKAHLSPSVRSYFGVPLLADGGAIGILQIDSTERAAWDQTDRLLVVCVAPLVAAAIQSARAKSRVTSAQTQLRRIVERWRTLTQLLENDVDDALRGLVEMADYVPGMRTEVDRLTAAIARVHAVAAADVDAPPPPAVDLRAAEKTPLTREPAQ
jgi:GAF domain-containing protein